MLHLYVEHILADGNANQYWSSPVHNFFTFYRSFNVAIRTVGTFTILSVFMNMIPI
jgi:hypothetical protein